PPRLRRRTTARTEDRRRSRPATRFDTPSASRSAQKTSAYYGRCRVARSHCEDGPCCHPAAACTIPCTPACEGLRPMKHIQRLAWSGAACIWLSAALVAAGAQKSNGKDSKDAPDAKRPQVRLKAQPVISVSPAKVVLTAEIVG